MRFLLPILLSSTILGIHSKSLPEITFSTCFEGCSCINKNNRSLEVSNCRSAFDINTNYENVPASLKTIQFNNVDIVDLRQNALERFQELENLQFNNSRIRNIHPQAFENNGLPTLYFANCKFDNAPYIKSQDLEEVLITYSNLKKVPKLDALRYLTLINLEGNKIAALKEKSFAALESVEFIYLANNELTNLPRKLFYNNTQIAILDVSNNSLVSFALDDETNLESLFLTSNRIKVFDYNSSKNLKSLHHLYLDHNEISEITHETLSNMPSLELLVLSYNKITKLSEFTFAHNLELEKLVLDGNNLQILPVFQSANTNFGTLYYFSCRNCGLTTLKPLTFSKMHFLNEINLSNNKLTALNEFAFSLVSSLSILDLSNNKLTSLGERTFADNKRLADINLSGNMLSVLSVNNFIYMDNLQKLNVSNCNLTALWTDTYKYKLKELEQLIIANNSIEDLTQEDLKVMPNLKVIDLKNNPLKCNRHLAQIIKWLNVKKVYSIENAHYIKRNEQLSDEASLFITNYDHLFYWDKLAQQACRPTENEMENINSDYIMQQLYQDEKELISSVPVVGAPHVDVDESDELSDEDDDDIEDDIEQDEVYEDRRDSFNLSQATYIISITSVFVFTALGVLTAAVTTTLIILRRNKSFSRANIPTLNIKIPRWENNLSLKKHSGSIYRPLSEEIPQLPKTNRYDFKAQPAVHSNINV